MKKDLLHCVIIGLLLLLTTSCNRADSDNITIEMVADRTGLPLGEYTLIEALDDKDLQEDGWGQQVWWIKQTHPIKKEILDSLVANDNRWEFQDDVRQQYLFSEIKVNKHRTIYISDDDSIMSLSYDWKK